MEVSREDVMINTVKVPLWLPSDAAVDPGTLQGSPPLCTLRDPASFLPSYGSAISNRDPHGHSQRGQDRWMGLPSCHMSGSAYDTFYIHSYIMRTWHRT